jgi:hypothetical protein
VISKTDLAPPKASAALARELRRIDPAASLLGAIPDPLLPDELMASDVYDAASKSAEVQRWLAAGVAGAGTEPHRHADESTGPYDRVPVAQTGRRAGRLDLAGKRHPIDRPYAAPVSQLSAWRQRRA